MVFSRYSVDAASLRVRSMSAWLGSGSPLGWLWTKIRPAVRLAIAGLNMSRGWASDAVMAWARMSTPKVSGAMQQVIDDL